MSYGPLFKVLTIHFPDSLILFPQLDQRDVRILQMISHLYDATGRIDDTGKHWKTGRR